MALNGLRMMPLFPWPSLKTGRWVFPSTASRLTYQVARSYGSHCLILLPEYTTRSIVCVHLSYRSRLRPSLPLCVGQVFFCDTVIQASRLYPRGPRPGQGYSVPVPHHLLTSSLIDPIRATQGHSPISLPCRLYEEPWLCGSA